MSYWHPDEANMHPALLLHHQEGEHRLLIDPVDVAPGGAVPALTYHNGPTIPDPKVVALYVGTFWEDIAQNDAFLKRVVEDGYLSAAEGQGTKPGTFLGSFDVPAPASTNITDADCRAILANEVGKNGIPANNENTLYLLIFPSGVTISFTAGGQSSCKQFCGYHSNDELNGQPLYYTVQPATDCNGCHTDTPANGLKMVQAHEIAEACTDPAGSGWFNDATGQENADECAWVEDQYGDDIVQGYAAENASGQWVNSLGAYVPPSSGAVATTLHLTADPNPVTVGQPVQMRAAVAAIDGSAVIGDVIFSIGSTKAPPVALEPDQAASVALTPQTAGTTTAGAKYEGDSGHMPSEMSLSLVVNDIPQPTHFKPSGPAAEAWKQLEAGGSLALSELELLLASDSNGPAAPAWRYLIAGGDVQALLDHGWGRYFRNEGAA